MIEYTPSLGLAKPDFNIATWHDEINGNFDTIDAMIAAFTGITGIIGVWANDTDYVVGNRVIDVASSRLYECLIAHTSDDTGTFLQDRTAHPTFWLLVSVGIPDPYSVPGNFTVGGNFAVVGLATLANVDINGGTIDGVAITGGTFVGTYSGIDTDKIGCVFDFAGLVAPPRTLFCFGQAISRTTYALLFAVISTQWGVGDGVTTFNLPDCRGRVIAGQDDMGGVSANRLTGLSGGVNGDTFAAVGGFETHTLIIAELAAHVHTMAHTHTVSGTSGVNSADHTHTFADTSGTGSANHQHVTQGNIGAGAVVGFTRSTGDGAGDLSDSSTGAAHTHAISGTTSINSVDHTHTFSATSGASSAANTGSVGSDGAHNNVQPTMIMNKVIYTGVL